MGKLERILYVEDDLDIQEVAKFALEELGRFTVKGCNSGSAALAAAPDFRPDLLLLDVMMPGMDGPTTLAGLRRLPQTAHVPAIFMTAKVQMHELAEYTGLGALGVIVKPFDPMTLAEQIQSLFTLWKQQG